MTRLIAVALLALPCAVPTSVNGSENLIPNCSFEVDANGDGMPDGWRFDWKYTHSNDRERAVEKHKPQVSWNDTIVHAGNRSLCVANQRRQDDGVWTLADMPVDGSVKAVGTLPAWRPPTWTG